MASTSVTPQVTPMTLITLKVSYEGSTRRFKLPLKDLGINVLETKLREILNIPDETEAVFERYSDSAGSFVTLDQQNISVYKQLNRAAKAKHKLKLKVTAKETPVNETLPVPEEAQPVEEIKEEPAEEDKEGPKPASVCDEAEEETTETAEQPAVESAEKDAEDTKTEEKTGEPITSACFADWTLKYNEHIQKVEELRQRLEEVEESPASASVPALVPFQPFRAAFAVCCNQCEQNIPEAHYHCSTCDDGDFDLCQECVDQGVTCYAPNHWLIKRFIKNGVITNSTTERLAPKQKQDPQPVEESAAAPVTAERIVPVFKEGLYSSIRTCNCCVRDLPEVEFVHCATCDDFDLCRACFAKNRHGHNPKHAFAPAVEGTRFDPEVAACLDAGRGQVHNAICDGCENAIRGIRHKCLDCPDWDYCNKCVKDASISHVGHRFVPVYEPLEFVGGLHYRATSRPTHVGICCDGPLCSAARQNITYIVGDRYKCAVCNDTDFCESCEAHPNNSHNKTHPLIKFKTPVRHVSVTTTGENQHGRQMPAMGDRPRRMLMNSRATETASRSAPALSSKVATVIDVKPIEPVVVKEEPVDSKVQIKSEVPQKPKAPEPDLVAVFVRDTVADGTLMGPDNVFEQTWVLRNAGEVAWPAGCSVRFVGGDYMGHVDSSHPAATQDIQDANESTICHSPVLPGEEHAFTVLLRTPLRSGRIVSNWRLTTADGAKFGHRLWCDVVVERPKVNLPPAVIEPVIQKQKEIEVVKSAPEPEPVLEHSQMIFPKLEKESPLASMIETAKDDVESEKSKPVVDNYNSDDEDWDVAGSDEGFLTDEEYDILDASDEEYNEAGARK
ncbi:next to BRCA1 gene 1 protein [Cladorrhinum samala]|uniref:Next to BRCA1 gene 1 protein n=1 Tax=Cladorrhinum samala TaxID=585594 RepID=A0AAV9HR28_9PEZI|nr:next to BRCA1 gene 1 protein [Cladorrhinum samala]